MNIYEATDCFKALSQPTRMRILNTLISVGRRGCNAGRLGYLLSVPNNTLSFHLSHLCKAELIASQKKGRQIIYHICPQRLEQLKVYLAQNYKI